MELDTWSDGAEARSRSILGGDFDDGEVPQVIVAPTVWQRAWSLASCVVVPEFSYDGWELASPGWSPPVD